MKTQIIQLNKNDDYISVRDKMNWSQTSRILLVWPRDGHVLASELELNLVKRHATVLGAQLAIVTRSSEVCFYAERVGIPVFKSRHHAQETHWRMDKQNKLDLHLSDTHLRRENLGKTLQGQSNSWLKHPTIRVISFGISVLALFILAIVILPTATLHLAPKTDTQSITFSVTADPLLKTINMTTGGLPTYIEEVIVEGRDDLVTSGNVVIPDQAAMAGLRFTNLSNLKINIPVGTVVTTLDNVTIKFITESPEEIAIGPRESVTLSARAINPGTSGNLPENTLVAIEGDLGLDLSVTNPYASYGGTDASVPSPTNQDLSVLRERLQRRLIESALAEIRSSLSSEDMIIPSSVKILEIIDEISTPSIGEPGKQLDLYMRIKVQAEVVSGEVIRSLVIPIMDANIPSGFTPLPGTLELIQLTSPTPGEDEKAQWTLRAQRQIRSDIPENDAIDMVKGLSIPLATEILNSALSLDDQPKIDITPSWWPRLPYIPMRIQVVQAITE